MQLHQVDLFEDGQQSADVKGIELFFPGVDIPDIRSVPQPVLAPALLLLMAQWD
jgi:hypothetical protein